MKIKFFFKGMAPIIFLILVVVSSFSITAIAQPTDPAVTQTPTHTKQNTDNTNTQYEEQNDAGGEETGNEINNESIQEDEEGNEPETEKEGIENADEPIDLAGKTYITLEAAKQIAESYLNAGSATKITLDDENGILVYSVEFGSVDVKVDATTGNCTQY